LSQDDTSLVEENRSNMIQAVYMNLYRLALDEELAMGLAGNTGEPPT